jgi:hypothetical protein
VASSPPGHWRAFLPETGDAIDLDPSGRVLACPEGDFSLRLELTSSAPVQLEDIRITEKAVASPL